MVTTVPENAVREALIADVPEAIEKIKKALAGHFHLTIARNYNDALQQIKSDRFSVVICGTHFDDSRMLELLGTVKMDLKMLHLPFVCFRHLHSRWSEETEHGIQLSAELLGACKFIDDAYNLKDEEILHAVQDCINIKEAASPTA